MAYGNSREVPQTTGPSTHTHTHTLNNTGPEAALGVKRVDPVVARPRSRVYLGHHTWHSHPRHVRTTAAELTCPRATSQRHMAWTLDRSASGGMGRASTPALTAVAGREG